MVALDLEPCGLCNQAKNYARLVLGCNGEIIDNDLHFGLGYWANKTNSIIFTLQGVPPPWVMALC